MPNDEIEAGADARAAKLLKLIGAKWTTQAVGVAAELGIADILADGSKPLAELAQAASCDPAALHRLMRALASAGIVSESADGFGITPLGSLLKADADPSLRSWAIWTARYQWGTWGHLLESVRTGQSARKLTGGSDRYGHVAEDAEAASVFNPAMVELTRLIARLVARRYDFSASRRVADVAGGYGELLVTILAANPHLRGVLFELPHAIDGARSRIAEAGFASRCELVAGSFFEWIPDGCDVYLLKSVLHNWNDERCGVLLGHCRRAMNAQARLVILERLMPERITGSPAEQAAFCGDLNMLVGLGGRERSEAEFARLLASAGLKACRSTPIALGISLIEARIS